MRIEARVIRPKEILSEKKIRANVLNALNKTGKEAKTLLGYATSTWNGEVPTFTVEPVRYAGGDARLWISVGPEGSPGYWKWIWLDLGTKIRYATMEEGFKPKTQSGSFYARPGKGGVAYVDRRVPRPGIQARLWDKLITDLMVNRLARRIDRAVKG